MNQATVDRAHAPPSSRARASRHRPFLRPSSGLLLAGLFLLAAGVRLTSLSSSTLLAERQFRSALIARHFYYRSLDDVEPWRLRIARLNRQREGRLEPPVLERVAAGLYRIAGGERLWIPRALSTAFWLLGGLFLYRLALRLMPPVGAIAGTAYFLLNPLGAHVSISFLPDPLMIALFVLALLAVLRYDARPGPTRLAFAALVAGLAGLVKPFCIPALAGAVVALSIHRNGFGRRALNRPLIALLGGALLPALAYYGYGMLIQPLLAPPATEVAAWDSLARSASVTFVPELLLEREYWTGWAATAVRAMGPAPLVAALIGIPLLARRGRALIFGLLAGYVVFCLTFTYLIPFAGHYHLQLLVVVALGLGQLAAALVVALDRAIERRYLWGLPAAAAIGALGLALLAVRDQLQPMTIESEEVAREIGELIGHSDRVAHVATYYGKPLQYHGEFYGTWWPSAAGDLAFRRLRPDPRTLEERWENLGFEPEYFVITDFAGYRRRHRDLEEFLEANCHLMASDEAYLIYAECAPSPPNARS